MFYNNLPLEKQQIEQMLYNLFKSRDVSNIQTCFFKLPKTIYFYRFRFWSIERCDHLNQEIMKIYLYLYYTLRKYQPLLQLQQIPKKVFQYPSDYLTFILCT